MNKKKNLDKKSGSFSKQESLRVLKIILIIIASIALSAMIMYHGYLAIHDLPINTNELINKIKLSLINTRNSAVNYLKDIDFSDIKTLYDNYQHILK